MPWANRRHAGWRVSGYLYHTCLSKDPLYLDTSLCLLVLLLLACSPKSRSNLPDPLLFLHQLSHLLSNLITQHKLTKIYLSLSSWTDSLNNLTISVRTRHLPTVVTVTFPQLSPSILWISPPAESVQISIKMLFFREKFKLLKRINNHTLKKNKRKSIEKLELFFVKRKFPLW